MEMETSYNWFLVALSFFVACFGSFTALQLMQGLRGDGENKWGWMLAATLALGGGAIWTMHFIGMLAYHTDMEVGYDPMLTFVSLLIALLVVGFGIFILSRNPNSKVILCIAGFITGLGVASMHYSGMAAMIMPAEVHYDNTLLAASIVIAIVAATAALWLAFNLEGTSQMLAAAIVMGIAVCGMHYTGMAAMTMVHIDTQVAVESSIEPLTLGLFIFCFSMLLLVLSLIVSMSQLQKKMYEELEADDDDDEEPASPLVGKSASA